jgi:histone-lysine N-methyltransferase SETMAR
LTQQKINELGWEVLPHPPYSPDVAPSDYHLFRSLRNFLLGKEFEDEEDVKRAITSFIASKPPEFFRNGIEKLVTKWGQVIDNEGQYIID